MAHAAPNHQPRPSRDSTSKTRPTKYSSTIRSMSESNLWLVAFSLAVIAILFSQEISDYIYANDENYLLKQYSSQRTPNVSAWKVVPMSARGGGYGVIATRQILPGELIMKEFPLVKIKIAPSTVDIANRKVERAIQELSGEDRNRFLGLSNAWQNQGDNQIQLSKYSGIFQTNGMSSGRGYMSIFPSISRLNHACTGAVNAVYHWRENEGREVVHVTKEIKPGEEIFLTYFDSKLPRNDRQSFLRQAYGFNCTCAVCSLDSHRVQESDFRITRINSLKATLSAWSPGSIGGAEAVQLIEDAIDLMTEEGMTYELGQLYADAAHIASAHSDFHNTRKYASLAAKHFSIELGPDSVEVAVANRITKNPTSSNVWATRLQETVRK
ncbi:hypothetical protein PCANC_04800 [Puccinia coronata f. sp. avenae]|uniref:SET domain-containing protein n=1 Tax=Puccinia coronata f. sp. avenae TaxID=200324 RepID=A0A2N5S3Q8_9BASI|nr:hypothetical protein PCANC_23445 [Puccinia coronata f. sp. avenae]PLW54424.1 hypothetical protein PCANC_04800 [Puccinia coronata f. sp. avenae]